MSGDFHRGGRVDPGSPEIRTGGMPEIVKAEILDASTARLSDRLVVVQEHTLRVQSPLGDTVMLILRIYRPA